MDLLEPMVQPYAWGSRTAIAELQGRHAPAPGPEAELWMGAHPSAPSGVERAGGRTTLDAVIAADPVGELGEQCASTFGGRLPFLLKVLAAEKSLSIQVHPSREQAEAGFAEENERGLAPGSAGRNYVDDWPKPEILCALTRFEVLAGMRDGADAAALLSALDVPELAPLAADLTRSEARGCCAPEARGCCAPEARGCCAPEDARTDVLARLLGWPMAQRSALITSVVAACERLAAGDGPYAAACAATARIAGEHPGDMGIVASLLLRHSVLEPGQATFMAAGGLHAYLRGTGVELLANSDNVVRAGLTGKHIDVPELIKLTDPGVDVPLIEGRDLGDRTWAYDSPAPEFRLYRAEPGAGELTLPAAGPRLVLCTEGTITLRSMTGSALKVARGESCFLSAADGAVTASGPGALFLAATGLSAASLPGTDLPHLG
ncbi:MAG: mannose-6-phosphate isomerase, class I [Nocardiopsaceae bacterium]|nr:mannose-6-phosphate isomerase, class I [Nocardiopsaceae bacterium]